MRATSAATAAWFGRSRLSSGSSSSSSGGRRASACAISNRCCSPPEHCADRAVRVRVRADEVDELVDPLPRRARLRRARQRHAVAVAVEPEPHDVDAADRASTDRSCGAGGDSRSRGRPRRPAGRARGSRPRSAGSAPRIALSSVDFPTPFGPRIATNSRSGMSRSTSRHTVRPPSDRRAPTGTRVASSSSLIGASACAARPAARAAGASCHSWNVASRGHERLGHRRDRDVARRAPRRRGAARRASSSGC